MFAKDFCHSYGVDGRPDLTRFGQIVRERRERLGRQQDRMTDYGGPSSTTMSKIERGDLSHPSPSTLRKLDTGLEWQPGSAATTLAGGTPHELSSGPLELSEIPIDDLLVEIRKRVLKAESLDQVQPRSDADWLKTALADKGVGVHDADHRLQHRR